MKAPRDTTRERILHSLRRRFRKLGPRCGAFASASAVTACERFVVLGDLQRTSLLELWRESNSQARAALVRAVAATPADFVVLLGDLVFQGDSALDWSELDELLAPLRATGRPVLPVLGNHDYGLRPQRGLAHFVARFPEYAHCTYFSLRRGPLACVFLDSNRSRLAPSAWAEQARWLEAELRRCDEDEGCRIVLLFVHHPPFTNSSVTGDDANVRAAFLPPFAAARKTRAMLSGHVHSYERFSRGGKMFIVAGGGGAPRVRLREGTARRHDDDAIDGGLVRPMHYLVGTLHRDRLAFEAHAMGPDGEAFSIMDRFDLTLV
jgi:Icc-related predicted phosphoesterase